MIITGEHGETMPNKTTQPKTTLHHTKDAKMAIRVRSSDLISAAISIEHIQADVNEFVFIRSISEFQKFQKKSGKSKSTTAYTTNNIFRAALWNARDIVDVLKQSDIAFEEILLVREMKGSTTPDVSGLASILLMRLPKSLIRLIAWIVDDPRRYLVLTKGARHDFTKENRSLIIGTARGDAAIMTDDEEQAITIKLKHGGAVYDMQDLRAQA